ncbi:DPH4 homolog [Arabidopsis lyrata subsp. lyrata]|nr:DPH4 homolog [Arabidopsis lyrata subsp. lyrata]|eukprot:XP_002874611.2 DPH4 homolog [Arabidopsis lyrata subsp. lyrata]
MVRPRSNSDNFSPLYNSLLVLFNLRIFSPSPVKFQALAASRINGFNMLFGENCVHETYYEILSVKEDASYEEIRNSYRSAILHSHPDKLNNNNSRRTSDDEKFLKIQKAWEVLSDAELRVVYDNDLRSSRHDGLTADEISIEDMSVEISGEVIDLFYQCRCGDYFCVDSSELGTMGFALLRDGDCVRVKRLGAFVASVVLPCGSCSLKTRVWVDSDMKISFQEDVL